MPAKYQTSGFHLSKCANKKWGFGFLPYLGGGGGWGATKKFVTSPCDGVKMQDFAKMQAKTAENVMALSFSLIIIIN